MDDERGKGRQKCPRLFLTVPELLINSDNTNLLLVGTHRGATIKPTTLILIEDSHDGYESRTKAEGSRGH